MKKRTSLVLVCILCLVFVMSGCNLFATNQTAYLNQKVVTIEYVDKTSQNNNITITKKDLVEAFNRYYETLSQNNYSKEQMIDYLINYLINQKVIINETKSLIEKEKITIKQKDKNYIWNNTFDNVVNILKDFEDEVIADWKLNTPSELSSEDKEEAIVYKPYKKEATIEKIENVAENEENVAENEWKIKILDTDNDDQTIDYPENVEDVLDINSVLEPMLNKIKEKIGDSKILKEAQKRYIARLKNYEIGQGLSTDDNSIWEREIIRIYNSVVESKYISLYANYIQNKNGTQYSVLSVNDIFAYLENKIKESYVKYVNNIESFKTDILSSREKVYYLPSNKDLGEYFYVNHILVKFTDEQKEELAKLDKLKDAGAFGSETNYQKTRSKIVNSTLVKENGKEIAWFTVDKLYKLMKEDLAKCDNNNDIATCFNKYLYKYSEDTGNKNQEFDYIIGTKDSKMVEEFTNASRDLYNNPNRKYGDLSEITETEYGLHIIMYMQPVTNYYKEFINDDFDYDTFSLTNATNSEKSTFINSILNMKLSELNSKTLFDKIYETLKSDNFSILEKLNLNNLKSSKKIKITKYTQNYKDML